MAEPWVRIEFEADVDNSSKVMFEPSGMVYAMSAGEVMSADICSPYSNTLRIVQWEGGISIWAPGAVITRDADGNKVDRLN